MTFTDIVVLGAGRGSAELIQLLGERTLRPRAVLDDRWPEGPPDVMGVEVVGRLADAPLHAANGRRLLLAIANAKSRSIRCEIHARLGLPDSAWAVFSDPSSSVAAGAELGAGCILYPGVRIAAEARLGRHVIVYYNSVIHHDCVLGEGVTVCAGVFVAGGVRVGQGSYLGMGCLLRDGVTVGRGVLVGMGAVVIGDVPDGATVTGVPAKVRKITGKELP